MKLLISFESYSPIKYFYYFIGINICVCVCVCITYLLLLNTTLSKFIHRKRTTVLVAFLIFFKLNILICKTPPSRQKLLHDLQREKIYMGRMLSDFILAQFHSTGLRQCVFSLGNAWVTLGLVPNTGHNSRFREGCTRISVHPSWKDIILRDIYCEPTLLDISRSWLLARE